MTTENNPNLYTVFQQRASLDPQETLLVVDQEVLRAGEFVAATEAIARGLLQRGIRSGDRVGLVLPNSGLWYQIYWAAVRIGAQPVPLDPQIGAWEMARLLGVTEMRACFAASRYRQNAILENLLQARAEAPGLEMVISTEPGAGGEGVIPFDQFLQVDGEAPVAPVADTDILMLACTSGSTGNPKVIVVPHLGFRRSQQDMADALGFSKSDVMLLGMPLYHQGGFGMGLQMVLNGGTVLYQPVFEPAKFLQTIQDRRVTVVQLTATLAKILLSTPGFDQYDLSSLRMAYFAGEVVPMELARTFFEKLGIRVINIIGSTETATMVIWDSEQDRDVDVSSFRALPFTAYRVLDADENEVANGDVGTIFIHTDALLLAYLKNETETGLRLRHWGGQAWFNTGDLGQRCPDGRVRFVGRVKRAIKRGANLVYPEEIESFLLTHPNIEAVAVTGQSHELMGEMVVAYVQPRQGSTFTRRDLVQFCHGQLAAYKIPDKLQVVDSIPKDIGKVQFKYLNKPKDE